MTHLSLFFQYLVTNTERIVICLHMFCCVSMPFYILVVFCNHVLVNIFHFVMCSSIDMEISDRLAGTQLPSHCLSVSLYGVTGSTFYIM